MCITTNECGKYHWNYYPDNRYIKVFFYLKMKNSKMELFNIQNGKVNIKITSYYLKKKPDNQDFEVRDGCVFETELCQLESITLLLLH